MGIVLPYPHRTISSEGQRSGRSSVRDMPVASSIGKTNSAGTPRLERTSQYQTCDCVVPIRSANGFWPPATTHARNSASFDMGPEYPKLGTCQPKNLSGTANRKIGISSPMEPADPKAFGARVRQRRKEFRWDQERLAKESGYSQTNIYWIEKGGPLRPHIQAPLLAGPLRTTAEWLLYGRGQKHVGPPLPLTSKELTENYDEFSLEEQQTVSELILKIGATRRQKRKNS